MMSCVGIGAGLIEAKVDSRTPTGQMLDLTLLEVQGVVAGDLVCGDPNRLCVQCGEAIKGLLEARLGP